MRAVSRHSDWAEHWSVRGSNVVQEQDRSSSLTRPDRPWGPPIILFSSYMVSFKGVKRPGRDADHTPPSKAEVKNGWSSIICLHGLERDNFIFL